VARPRQPYDQRHTAASLFAASERTVVLMLPDVDIAAMNLDLAEISAQMATSAQAVVILDQADCHGARALQAPDNISLRPLLPCNPVETLWQFVEHDILNTRLLEP
jgi:hypothetical protein